MAAAGQVQHLAAQVAAIAMVEQLFPARAVPGASCAAQ